MQHPRTQAPPVSVTVAGTAMYTLRQIDEWLGRPKGTAFRAFKALRREGGLLEGRDFLRLDADGHGGWIEQRRAQGQVYRSTIHVVVFTAEAVERLHGRVANIPDRG
ncbi:hypothetical protein KBTX_03029 [wastewater metagenome]|uniref:Uncharacterized protein n=2 Tax=unclassified sequences TaxID=12908 RepID=A0A5B8RC29_9ZZZZ|nr:hypothetical protein KBTEX_03029 [uncultured organism]